MGAEDAVDCRQWTQHHLVAADIRVAPAMALTPPQGDADADGMDVNVRGPGQASLPPGCPLSILLMRCCIWVCFWGKLGVSGCPSVGVCVNQDSLVVSFNSPTQANLSKTRDLLALVNGSFRHIWIQVPPPLGSTAQVGFFLQALIATGGTGVTKPFSHMYQQKSQDEF